VAPRDRVDVHQHFLLLANTQGRHLGEPDDTPPFAELNRRRAADADEAFHRSIDRENARALFSEETL
jgi:hypothetical protein